MADIVGIGVSHGQAVGPVVHMPGPIVEPPLGPGLPDGASAAALAERITAASGRVCDELTARAASARGDGKAILEAAALMAVDPILVGEARLRVSALGSPARAVWDAAGEFAAGLTSLGGYLAERARDVADVRDRIVAELSGLPAPGIPDRSEPYVLIARNLAPAEAAMLDPATCVAVVTAEGGPTSHAAILLRSTGTPAVMAARGVLELADDTVVLVDGSAGTVIVEPDPAEITRARKAVRRARTFDGRGQTADGRRVRLMANVGDPGQIGVAVATAAEGVGLFRTEFCFLDHHHPPTVDEQVAAYRQVLGAFPGQRVVVRTLDGGADKPLLFLDQPPERNPALGIRGVRIGKNSPQVVADQLTAISRAARRERAEVWVMAPMVATVDEAADFVARCDEAGLEVPGVMIEVPAAALSASQVLQTARFASIGTNDLTQYTMAADRDAGDLAQLTDPWQPAVLQLVELTCRAGQERARPVGVCGEAAADPALACVLVGLGAASLSMTPQAIPDVAAALRKVSYEECVRLARLAVAAPGARQARQAVRAELPVFGELGL
ncbi:MAG: phosphoenolpyruvate--protein phosphotransferase [Jiangellaceae bacterium]